MDRVHRSWIVGAATLILAGVALAQPSGADAGVSPALPPAPEVDGSSSAEQTAASDVVASGPGVGATSVSNLASAFPAAPSQATREARYRAFTQRLVEQRTTIQFAREFDDFERRRAFTDQLVRQRAQTQAGDQKHFESEVERYARLYSFTLQLQEDRDTRDALEFAKKLALEERKRAFTLQLIEARQQSDADSDNR